MIYQDNAQGKGQKGDGNGTVSNINNYSDNSALELTQYNYSTTGTKNLG